MVDDLEPVIPEMFEPDAEAGAGRRYLETLRKREMATGRDRQRRTTLGAIGWRRRGADSCGAWRIHDTSTPLPLRTISHLDRARGRDRVPAAVAAVDGDGEFRFLRHRPARAVQFLRARPDAAARTA